MCRLAAIVVALAAVAGCHASTPPLTLATTTSVGNSGLLDVLLRAAQRDLGVVVRPLLVGSGRALALLEDGQVDVVISHAPRAEAAHLARHPGWRQHPLMTNDFVIVGPDGDPAGVRRASSARAAFQAIASGGASFISRDDGSGTHEREMSLWEAAGIGAPPRVAAGQGMGATLRIADQMRAYALTDRATFSQNAPVLSLRIVSEGDPALRNSYSVLIDTSGPRAREARRMIEWLTTGGGREVIASYRIAGVPAFTPAAPRSSQDPEPPGEQHR